MVRGKKGFQRIIWAFQNVLDQRLNWLFFDLKGPNDGSGPIAELQPKAQEVTPQINTLEKKIIITSSKKKNYNNNNNNNNDNNRLNQNKKSKKPRQRLKRIK